MASDTKYYLLLLSLPRLFQNSDSNCEQLVIRHQKPGNTGYIRPRKLVAEKKSFYKMDWQDQEVQGTVAGSIIASQRVATLGPRLEIPEDEHFRDVILGLLLRLSQNSAPFSNGPAPPGCGGHSVSGTCADSPLMSMRGEDCIPVCASEDRREERGHTGTDRQQT